MLLRTLKIYNKNEFALLLVFALTSRVLFLLSLGACTALASDEEAYLEILDSLFSIDLWSQTLPTNGNPLSYYLWLIPAKLLTLIGIPNWIALRITSLLFFTFSILLIFRLLRNVIPRFILSKFLIAITFIPSFFIYTSLGIRESFIIFLIAFVFYELSLFHTNKKLFNLVFYFLGLTVLCQIKWFLGLILFVSTFWILFLEGRKFWVRCFKIIFFLSMLLTFSLSNAVLQTVKTVDFNSVVDPAIKNKTNELRVFFKDTPKKISEEDNKPISSTVLKLQECKELNKLGFLENFDFTKNLLVNIKLPHSSQHTPATDFAYLENGNTVRHVSEAPVTFLLFWFSPLFSGHDGLISKLFFEGFIWGVLIFFVFIRFSSFLAKKRKIEPIQFSACAFIILYMIFCAFTEVNIGTSMRHRAILLFPTVIALFGAGSSFFRSRGNHNQ